ncbi:hypothetical protein [Arthrobacter sp. N1]|uniref:hypothetical protein n=1 Tax=Arthrobacter sp. N1 TaxID=619291 RepID=UPI003BB196E5
MSQTSTPSNVVSIASRQGKHTATLTDTTGYFEYWAKRYPGGQRQKEQDRLRRGLAKHRPHRMVLSSLPPSPAPAPAPLAPVA